MTSLRRAVINVQRILTSSTICNRNSIAPSSPLRFYTLFRPQYGWVSNYSSDSTQSLDIDFSSDESKRRLFNRLLYRSKQRGFLELDLVLGRWVEEHIHSMDQNGDLENPDLWKWLTGQEQPPEAVKNNPVFSAVHDKVMNNLNSHASPETRSTPGQTWRIEDSALKEQLGDLETLSEELIDRTLSTFLQQVEDGNWKSGGWPERFTDYSLSKLAVNAYTRLMAKELSDRPEGQKIYINCFCPGWVKTAMTGWDGNISAENGADTGVWLALLTDLAISGKFFAERREISF